MNNNEKEWVMENLPEVSRLISRVVEILPDVVDAVIDNLPTIINEKLKCQNCEWYNDHRTHGKWIKHIDDLFPEESTEECSICHEEQRITGNDDNFCPNCGADMREGEQND